MHELYLLTYQQHPESSEYYFFEECSAAFNTYIVTFGDRLIASRSHQQVLFPHYCTALHCTTLHYTTLHYTTLHLICYRVMSELFLSYFPDYLILTTTCVLMVAYLTKMTIKLWQLSLYLLSCHVLVGGDIQASVYTVGGRTIAFVTVFSIVFIFIVILCFKFIFEFFW